MRSWRVYNYFIGVEASMVMQWTVNPPPLARLVRSQDTPPILSRCSAVWLAHLLWEQGVQGSNPCTETNFSPTSTMVVQRFCNPWMAVRFCRGAPS